MVKPEIKRFEFFLEREGCAGGRVQSFTVKVEAETEGQAEENAKAVIFRSPWMKSLYDKPENTLKHRELNGDE